MVVNCHRRLLLLSHWVGRQPVCCILAVKKETLETRRGNSRTPGGSPTPSRSIVKRHPNTPRHSRYPQVISHGRG